MIMVGTISCTLTRLGEKVKNDAIVKEVGHGNWKHRRCILLLIIGWSKVAFQRKTSVVDLKDSLSLSMDHLKFLIG